MRLFHLINGRMVSDEGAYPYPSEWVLRADAEREITKWHVAVDVLKETQRQLNERFQQAISDLRVQIANFQGAYRTKDAECEDLKRRLAIAERARA